MSAPAPAHAPSRRDARWGLGDVAAGWLIAYSSAALISAVVLALAGYEPGDDLPLSLVAATYPPLWLGFVGVPIWAAATKGNGWLHDFVGSRRPADLATDAAVGIPVGVLAQLLVVPLISWPVLELSGTSVDDLAAPARELADKATGTGGQLLFLLIVGLLAPVAEELFFRGLALRAFEKRWGTTWAVIGSSVFFGATHLQALQFPALTVAGVIFALLVVKTGRLLPAVIAHMAFNVTTVVALLWL